MSLDNVNVILLLFEKYTLWGNKIHFISIHIAAIMFAIFFKPFLYCPMTILFVTKHTILAQVIYDNISDYDWTVWCLFQANGYDCSDGKPMLPKFYYDLKLQDCRTFTFGLCDKSKNEFETRTDCRDRCTDAALKPARENVSAKIYCRYQPDFGYCNNYNPMYYYDVTQGTCRGFSYSGCGGNINRFPNAQICAAICGGIVEY